MRYDKRHLKIKKEKFSYGVLFPFEEKFPPHALKSAFKSGYQFWRLDYNASSEYELNKELIKTRGLTLVTKDDFVEDFQYLNIFPALHVIEKDDFFGEVVLYPYDLK